MENTPHTNVERLLSIVAIQQEIATAKLDLETVMDLVAERMRSLTEADGAAVELVEGDELVYRAASGTISPHLGLRLAIDKSISGLCVRSGGIMRSDDTETDERVDRSACRRIGARSMVVVPLHHDRRTVGVLKVSSVRPGAFGEEAVYTLQLMTTLIAAGMSHTAQFEAEQTLLEERTRALEEIQSSEEHLRAIFEQSAVGVAEMDLDGRFVLLNQRFCEITGYSREELLDMRVEEIVHPDDLPESLRLLERLAREGKEFDAEKRYVRKDGSVAWVNDAVSPRWESSEKPAYAVAVVQDITRRKRREENAAFLAETRDELSRLSSAGEITRAVGQRLGEYLGVSLCLMAEIDEAREEGAIRCLWNTADAPPLPGVVSIPELVGEEFRETVRAGETFAISDTGAHPLADAGVYAAPGIRSALTAPFFRDGRWKVLLSVCDHRPRQWREDEIELFEELSNRVFVRLERARAEEALRVSEEKYRTLFESMDEGYVLVDVIFDEADRPVDLSYLEANPAAARMAGAELTGQRTRRIFPELESRWFETFGRVARSGAGERHEFYAAPTGAWYNFYAFKVGEPEQARAAAVYEDVTERRRTEEALLEIREAERRRIARDLHDSVLQDISGALQTIQALQAERQAEQQGCADATDDGLDQSLGALRQAAGGLRGAIYDLRRDDERPLINEVEALVELNRQMIPECDLTLHVERGFPEEIPEAVSRELLRIVHEGLVNIRRHSGARRANVTLSVESGEVRAGIMDDGRGFDRAETPEGMGLSGMRERVAAMGGELQMRSEPGKGTSFTMTIPLSRS